MLSVIACIVVIRLYLLVTSNKQMKKIFLLLGFIVLSAFVVSFLYSQGLFKETPVKLPLIFPTPKPIFQEYVNQDYKFSIAYPSDWKISDWDLTKTTGLESIQSGTIKYQLTAKGEGGEFEVLVWENNSKANVTDFLNWYLRDEIDPKNVPTEPNTVFQNLEAIKITQFSQARKKVLQYLFFNKDTYLYELLFERNDMSSDSLPNIQPPANKAYDYIMTSFKILNQTSPTNGTPQKTDALVNLAKEDLAQKLAIDISAIEVVMMSPVEWGDASLGCPEPDKFYAQVVTSGYLITLRNNGKIYPYHTDLSKRVILCTKG